MNRHNDLHAYSFEGNIDSEVVITCIDEFCKKDIKRETFIIIDNAPVHTSEAFTEKMAEWETKNLKIFRLPSYSPELNLIEILWRFIKYEWIELQAYTSWKNLVEYVENVIKNFGTSQMPIDSFNTNLWWWYDSDQSIESLRLITATHQPEATRCSLSDAQI